MIRFSLRNPRRVLVLFLILSALLVPMMIDVFPLKMQIKEVTAQSRAPLPTTWMNVTGANPSHDPSKQDWIFRVGYPSDSFSITIDVNGVTNLFTWEFQLRWKASVLDFGSVAEGSFLSSGGATTFYSEVHEDEVDWDYILVNCTLQSGSGVSGSGRIATVTFVVQGSGETPLDLLETKLQNASQARLKHSLTDGYVLAGDNGGLPLFYMVPQSNIANPNELFDVTVWIDEVSDLYTWEFTVRWSPFYLLTAKNVTDKRFLVGSPYSFVPASGDGWAAAASTLIGEQEGTSGSGPLATITFQVSQYGYLGKTFLNITDTALKAIDTSVEPPELYDLTHTAFGGYFRTSIPLASFTFTPERPAVNKTVVTFNATESTNPAGGTIVNYYWDFKDGTTINTANPIVTHTFSQVEEYSVNLTVTDDQGETASTENPVTVVLRDAAVTQLLVSHKAAMAGTQVSITVSVKNNGAGYKFFDTESFSVKVYALDETGGNVTLGTSNVVLEEGEYAYPNFVWDTTGLSQGVYTVKAEIPPLPDENYENNNDANTTVTIASYNLVDYPVTIGGLTLHVLVKSNSTLPLPPPFQPTSFYFNQTALELGFNVSGTPGLFSYCNITIPKSLLRSEPLSEWKILFDSQQIVAPLIEENSTHTFISFNYTLSEHKIQVIGTTGPGVPIASFTVSPTKEFIFIGEVMTFNASGSYDADGYITEYFFDFKDGSNATGTPNYEMGTGRLLNVSWVFEEGSNTTQFTTLEPALNHSFEKPAITSPFNVKLEVTDNDDFSGVAFTQLKVYWAYDIAITDITTSSTPVIIGDVLTVNVTVTNIVAPKKYLSFNATIFGNDSPLGPDVQGVASTPQGAASGSQVMVSFSWNTSNVAVGTYALKVHVEVTGYDLLTDPADFPPEINMADNTVVYGDVLVKKWDSTLTLEASSTNTTIGTPIILNGVLSPIREGVSVTIQTKFEQDSWSNKTSVQTNLQGRYTYVWTPTTAGTYQVRASWSGDAVTSANMSNIKTITVRKLSSAITLEANPSSITLGSQVTLDGTIEPSRTNAQVTIYARKGEAEWVSIATPVTDDQGYYSFEWEPTETGTYDVQAKWSGDANTLAGESDVKQVEVNAASAGVPMDWIIFGAIGIAAIVIVGLAIYFMRIKRKSVVVSSTRIQLQKTY